MYKLALTFLLVVFYSYGTSCKNPVWDECQDLSYVLESLNHGELIYTCPMREFLEQRNKQATFNNEVHYGILKYQDNFVAVALKPKAGDEISSIFAEKIAYDIYEALIAPHTGHHFIPPTTVRLFSDGRLASCQYFVETEDHEDMWKEEFRAAVFQHVPHEHVQEMALFNAIFNNWDRHPGNYMATFREGVFHLASIDNEAIENKSILTEWGKRSYIPILFTDDVRAQIDQEIYFDKECSLEDFKSLVASYGFTIVPRVKSIYNNLFQRGDQQRAIYISKGMLLIKYHEGNKAAFPLPQGPYSSKLIEVYRNINSEQLEDLFAPLINQDLRFKERVNEVLMRRDLFLNHVSCNEGG